MSGAAIHGFGTDALTDPDRTLLVAKLYMPRPDVAEDAEPLVAGTGPERLIGVFDGLGGAGARAVDGDDGNRSSAYYAARIACQAAREAFDRGVVLDLADEAAMADAFATAVADALARRNVEAPAAPSVVRSSLIRSYPTTAAMIAFGLHQSPMVDATSIWAGDSRCYVLTPARGLQQLSRDDSRTGSDPMVALREDSPMSKMLTADGPCKLNCNRKQIEAPAILVVSTDGSHACLPSPMHFERVLLEAMVKASDVDEWQSALHDHLRPLANDDISLVTAFIGWSSIADAAAAFVDRLEMLRHALDPIEANNAEAIRLENEVHRLRKAAETRLDEEWDRYRQDYMALMSQSGGDR